MFSRPLTDDIAVVEKDKAIVKKDSIDKSSVSSFLGEKLGYTEITSLTDESAKFIFKAKKNDQFVALKISWPDENGENEKKISEILPLSQHLNTPKFIDRYENITLKSKDNTDTICTFEVFELPLMDSSFNDYVKKMASITKSKIDNREDCIINFNELRRAAQSLLEGYKEIYEKNILPQDTGNHNILIKKVQGQNGKTETNFALSDFGLFQTKDIYTDTKKKFFEECYKNDSQTMNAKISDLDQNIDKLFKEGLEDEKRCSVSNVANAVLCLYMSLKEGESYNNLFDSRQKEIVNKYLGKDDITIMENLFLRFVNNILSNKYNTPEEALQDPFFMIS